MSKVETSSVERVDPDEEDYDKGITLYEDIHSVFAFILLENKNKREQSENQSQ